QAGDHRGRGEHRGRRGRRRVGLPQSPPVRRRRVRRPLPGAARAAHQAARGLQADEGGRRLLAGRREAPDAAADLRHRLAEAERRDHRKLGVELDLISFPDELGGGLAVWHPKGAMVRKQMEDFSRAEHEAAGYEFVFTPHLTKGTLFETSGHLDFYADGMYPPMEMEGAKYYPKPMNCPFHCLIFRTRTRSYRELPLR